MLKWQKRLHEKRRIHHHSSERCVEKKHAVLKSSTNKQKLGNLCFSFPIYIYRTFTFEFSCFRVWHDTITTQNNHAETHIQAHTHTHPRAWLLLHHTLLTSFRTKSDINRIISSVTISHLVLRDCVSCVFVCHYYYVYF